MILATLPLFRFLNWWRLHDQLANVSVVVLDVDGVLTDGGLWYDEQGTISKRFDVRDGLGIRWLQHFGIEVVFFSGGRSGATERRAQHLGIRQCWTGVKDKQVSMQRLKQVLGCTPEQIVYVGDDLNDLAVRGEVALLVSTADAAFPLLQGADAVLRAAGGCGAVRELAERLLRARGQLRSLQRHGWRDRND